MKFQMDADGNLRHMKGLYSLRPAFSVDSIPAARMAQCEAMKAASSPFESVKSLASIRGAVEGLAGPRYGRPSDRFGPPTALFSPELAHLKHDPEHLDSFTPDVVDATLAFDTIEEVTSFFDNEDGRAAILGHTLSRILVDTSQWHFPIEPRRLGLKKLFPIRSSQSRTRWGLGGSVLTGSGCIQ